VAAALIGMVLLVVPHKLHAPGIWRRQPLPSGKVRPQLVNALDTAVLLTPDGSLWAWGGTYFNLTNVFPQPATLQVPRRIGLDSNWMRVAFSGMHTVALKNDGSLWAWGQNTDGAFGLPNLTNNVGTPTRIGTETNWTQIAAGTGWSLALKVDGSLWAWGRNPRGQLGNGTTRNTFVPTMMGQDRDWRTMAAGYEASIALKSDGTIWLWGFDGARTFLTPRQIGIDTNWLALSARGFTVLALKSDGTLWLKSGNAYPNASLSVPGLSTNFIQIGPERDWAEIYAGEDCSFFARKKDGSWWGCGANYGGQFGRGTNISTLLASPTRLPLNFEPWAFTAGGMTTLLLAKDGQLWAWGTRLGAGQPSAARRKIQTFLSPVARHFQSLRFLLKYGTEQRYDIDQKPYLLWELPAEVRRALGTGPNGSTNNSTSGHPADASHE